MIAGDLRCASIDVNLTRKLVGDIVAQAHDERCRPATHSKSPARAAGVGGVVGRAIRERVIEDFHGACAGSAVIGDSRNVDAGEGRTQLQGIHTADVIDDVVVSLNGTFRRIDGRKVDAVAVVAMDQIVMHMEIELVESGGVATAAGGAGKRRRVKLKGAAGEIIVNVVPTYIDVVGVGAEINSVIEL